MAHGSHLESSIGWVKRTIKSIQARSGDSLTSVYYPCWTDCAVVGVLCFLNVAGVAVSACYEDSPFTEKTTGGGEAKVCCLPL